MSYLTAKGRIIGHDEETECAQCWQPLESGDRTTDIFTGGLDDSDMIARCCSNRCAMEYLSRLA